MNKNLSSFHEQTNCPPDEIATKSLFLGPRAENADWLRHQILYVLDHFFQWRKDYMPTDGKAISRDDQKQTEFINSQNKIQDLVLELCHRFDKEIPQFSPRYIGHMYSELSLPSILGNFLATLHNPNILSTEASRVGAFIEEEAINELAEMLFYDKNAAEGHFTSCGTVANIEALWRARYTNDHFLAMGTYLNLHHKLALSFFDSCHMGWEKFRAYQEQYNISEDALRAYSYVFHGPWLAQEKYISAFGKMFKGSAVLVPNSKHYSWLKAVSLLGLGDVNFIGIKLTAEGKMSIPDLKIKISELKEQDIPIMMIVSILGTTELGLCDQVDKIQELLFDYEKNNYFFWHHVDAAYGGYFATAINKNENKNNQQQGLYLTKEVENSFKALKYVQSITVDPHKLGYIPYACGAIITKNSDHYKVSAFEAKYLQSPTKTVDRWMKTLEGSRSAQGATATWLSSKSMGLNPEGHGLILGRTIKARIELEKYIRAKCPQIALLESSDLNLLCMIKKGSSTTLSQTNLETVKLINDINNSNKFTVSKTTLKSPEYDNFIQHNCQSWGISSDGQELVLLRLTLMNPFFLNKETKISYLEEFTNLLNSY